MATKDEEKGEERLERAVAALGISIDDRAKALEIAKFLVRVGTIDVAKLPKGVAAGDTVCNSGC